MKSSALFEIQTAAVVIGNVQGGNYPLYQTIKASKEDGGNDIITQESHKSVTRYCRENNLIFAGFSLTVIQIVPKMKKMLHL